MSERPTCVDCGAKAPEAETTFALIRVAGWRLTRPVGPDGRPNAQWRCARCWSAFKGSGRASPKGANHRV